MAKWANTASEWSNVRNAHNWVRQKNSCEGKEKLRTCLHICGAKCALIFSAVKISVKMTQPAPCYCQATRWPWSAATLVPHSHTSLKAVLHGESPGDFRDQKKGRFSRWKTHTKIMTQCRHLFFGKVFNWDSPWLDFLTQWPWLDHLNLVSPKSDKTFTICNSTDFSDFLTQLHSQSSGQIGNVTLPGSMGNSLTSLGDGVGWPHVHSRNVYIYIYQS